MTKIIYFGLINFKNNLIFSIFVEPEKKERGVIDLMISELNSLAYNDKSVTFFCEEEPGQNIQPEKPQEFEGNKPDILDELLKSPKDDEKKDSKDLEKKLMKTRGKDSEKIKDFKKIRTRPSPEDEYARHTELYMRFFSEYMRSTNQNHSGYNFYSSEETSKTQFSWGDEVINYKERKELVRKMQLNKVMQGDHNYVDPQDKEAYEHWKNVSKFNMLMSFHMYANVFNCG